MEAKTSEASEVETKPAQLRLSPSVKQAMGRVGMKKPISAATLIDSLLQLHGEYGNKLAASVQLKETPTKRTSGEWVAKAQELFDDERIRSSWRSPELPEFHGRLLLVGLGLLEPPLRRQLESEGLLTAVIGELHEPLYKILSEYGSELYEDWQKGEKEDLSDTVPTWPDDPMLQLEQDLLGRAAFARFLAKRIAAIPEDSNAYSIHIYGPWGAGKSTLLNFLRLKLEENSHEKTIVKIRNFILKVLGRGSKFKKKDEWIVVEFNAWRNQQIQPPWWSLMESVFTQTRKRLNPWELFLELWWRFNAGRQHYLIVALGVLWLIVLLPWFATLLGWQDLQVVGKNAESVSKILALIATIWGGVFAVNRSLLGGSARAAQNYTELTRDPTSEIRRRFKGLMEKLQPERVAIVIDDLDRCQSGYVVDLLEGIQTLFRDAPVVFIIAADRRWLNACYEDAYGKLGSLIREPGKPLGTLFLEKAFRFSTPMPGIPEKLKQYYWHYLLRLRSDDWRTDVAKARQNASEKLEEAQSEKELRTLVAESGSSSFAEQRALREEAAVKLAAPEIIDRIEHTLKPYANLLEPNPRGMKLLVNGYSANRALAILAEVEIELHQLALWTILNSRWPQLADYLTAHPEKLEKSSRDVKSFPEHLQALFDDSCLIEILDGGSIGKPLTRETLERCVRMQA